MLFEGATLIRFRDSYPLYRVAQLLANEGGGRIDETDPLAVPYRKKNEAYQRKEKQPRRIPYEVTDFFMPWEREPYSIRMLTEQAKEGDPYQHVPLSILLEVKAGLDAGDLPAWFYSTLADLKALQKLEGPPTP